MASYFSQVEELPEYTSPSLNQERSAAGMFYQNQETKIGTITDSDLPLYSTQDHKARGGSVGEECVTLPT